MNDSTQDTTDQGGCKWCRCMGVESMLDSFNKGPTLRCAISFLVQIASVLLALSLLIDWVRMWKAIQHMTFVEGLGYAIWLLTFLAAGFLALKVMFSRGGSIREMPESEYVVTPVVGLLMAMLGEMAFVFLGVISVAAMIARWCGTEGTELPLYWLTRGNNAFVDGLFLFVACWLNGFFALVVGRWLREMTLVVVQIAQDVRAIRGKA